MKDVLDYVLQNSAPELVLKYLDVRDDASGALAPWLKQHTDKLNTWGLEFACFGCRVFKSLPLCRNLHSFVAFLEPVENVSRAEVLA